MTPSFNLVDRAWIPCVEPGGRIVNYGLRDALSQRPSVQGTSRRVAAGDRIAAPPVARNPTPRFWTQHGPVWAELWKDGRGAFDPVKVDTYLKSPAIYSRFDLFDAKYPFYQLATLPLGEPDPKNMGRGKFVRPIWQMATSWRTRTA